MKNEPHEVTIKNYYNYIYYILKFVIILLMCLENQIAQLNTQFEVAFMGCIRMYMHIEISRTQAE